MSHLTQNLRYAFCQFRKSPGFTAAVPITLTLCIGVNSDVFKLIYGMLLKPLPLPHPEQFYRIGDTTWDGCSDAASLMKTAISLAPSITR